MVIRMRTIGFVEYYEVYDPVTNSVGDIFTNWRDIPAQRQKLYEQDARSKALRIKLNI